MEPAHSIRGWPAHGGGHVHSCACSARTRTKVGHVHSCADCGTWLVASTHPLGPDELEPGAMYRCRDCARRSRQLEDPRPVPRLDADEMPLASTHLRIFGISGYEIPSIAIVQSLRRDEAFDRSVGVWTGFVVVGVIVLGLCFYALDPL